MPLALYDKNDKKVIKKQVEDWNEIEVRSISERVLRRDLTTLTNSLASSPARFDEDYNLKWFSESITIVDQSVHELCSLVSDSVLDLSCGLHELQSALEGFLILIGLRTETWGLEVQFDRESSVCEDSFMQSGDVGRASSPSITLCDAYSAIGDGGNSSPSLFVRELVSSMASLVAHAVMKHCRYSDCLCGVLKLERIASCPCWYRERELKLRSSDHEPKQAVITSGIESSIASWLRSCLGIELRRSEVMSWDHVTNGNMMSTRFRVRDREFSTVRVYRRGDYGFAG
ncbi:hypothetical protein DY000_02017101 [Brassica cretica]|uniref:Uncharacterized protein n=1 Tax=Brassica cretica TaxID=69181 RepID=A0ABQ7CTH9_BRACR|nr:hypothetical protein DY000_02017101 [Brassica cretica]